MNLTAQQKLLDLFGKQCVIRSRDLEQPAVGSNF
jgi:hypothetical protein